jgi:hypothetical protein
VNARFTGPNSSLSNSDSLAKQRVHGAVFYYISIKNCFLRSFALCVSILVYRFNIKIMAGHGRGFLIIPGYLMCMFVEFFVLYGLYLKKSLGDAFFILYPTFLCAVLCT